MTDPWNASANTEMRHAEVMPPKRRRIGTWVAVAAAALVVAAGVGVLLAARPGLRPAAGASPTPSCDVIGVSGCETKQGNGGGNVVYSPPAAQAIPAAVKQACDLNEHMRAASDGDLTGDGATINQIVSLLSTADVSLRINANLLKDFYADAVAAKGGSQDFATKAHLLGASLNLSTACLNAGWRSS